MAAIKKIVVVNVGESFTALRIGVLTANALGYALGIPVISNQGTVATKLKKFSVVAPIYQREPNIGQ